MFMSPTVGSVLCQDSTEYLMSWLSVLVRADVNLTSFFFQDEYHL